MSRTRLAVTFLLGLLVGFGTPRVVSSLRGTPAPDKWIDTEEETLKRMGGLQDRLEQLEKTRPDSVEALSKQAEVQQGIEQILTKYREAKYAKVAPFAGPGATVFAALLGWVAGRQTQNKKTSS